MRPSVVHRLCVRGGFATHPVADAAQGLAKSLGADWAGGPEELPGRATGRSDHLRANLLVRAIGVTRRAKSSGRVVCASTHMSDIPSFPYNILWRERQLLSMANLTRGDGIEFFKVAARAGIHTHTTVFPLAEANEVLARLRSGQISGAAVLQP